MRAKMTPPVSHEHRALASEQPGPYEYAEKDCATGRARTYFLPVASSTMNDIVSQVTQCTIVVVTMRPARMVLS